MTDISQLSKWNRDISRAIAALGTEQFFPTLVEGPYREDPFYQTSMHQPRSKIYRLSRVTMGKLHDSDYYRNYYADTGTCDEEVFFAKLSAGDVINLSMFRLVECAPFSAQEAQSPFLLP